MERFLSDAARRWVVVGSVEVACIIDKQAVLSGQ